MTTTPHTTTSGAADLMRNALRETAAVLVLEDAFPDLLQMVKSALAASAPVAPTLEGFVLAPHYRGYANLGTGQYVLNHTAPHEPAELIISIASEEDKAGRTIGDDRGNPAGKAIQPDEMAVRLAFTSVAGLDALEKQLRYLREVHFPQAAPVAPAPQPAPPTEKTLEKLRKWEQNGELIERAWKVLNDQENEIIRLERELAAAPKAGHIPEAGKKVGAPITEAEQAAWHAGLDEGRSQARVPLQQGEYPVWPEPAIFDGVDRSGNPVSHGYSATQVNELLDAARGAAQAAQAAPADKRNTKTHDLLSTMIGLFMGQRHKIGYKDNSVIAKVVAEAVEHLKDWPYPEAAPAPVAEDAEDAARYRWLREEAQYFPTGRAPAAVLCDEHDLFEKGKTPGEWGFITGKALDGAIDIARAQAAQPEGGA